MEEEHDPFYDFLKLFDMAREESVANKLRLKIKLANGWDKLDRVRPKIFSFCENMKQEYTLRLIKEGRIDKQIADTIRLFKGTIVNIEVFV